jgi:hypothetical protein
MHVHDLELKISSEPILREFGDFSSLSFFASTKDVVTGGYNPVEAINCSYRTDPESAKSLHGSLIKGRRVRIAGLYEPQSFEAGGDPSHNLFVEKLEMAPKVLQSQEVELSHP